MGNEEEKRREIFRALPSTDTVKIFL